MPHAPNSINPRPALRLAALCILLAVRGAGPARAAEGTNAIRIVSLGPAITEQLLLLDRAESLVGVTSFCQLPEDLAPPSVVGTVTGINVEQIVTRRPDIVMAIGLTDPRYTRMLEKLGVRVERFDYAKDFEGICEQFLRIGRLVGREAEARAIVDEVRGQVAATVRDVEGRSRPRVFVEIGARPLFTANADSYINDIERLAGGVNVAAEADSGFYSREQVLADDPEVILIVTMGVAAEEERASWLAARPLAAAEQGRVHVLDAYTVCSPTPYRFAESVRTFAALFYPEAEDAP